MDEIVKIYKPTGIGYAPAVTIDPPKVTYEEALNGIRRYAQRHPTSEFRAESKWKRFCDYIFDLETWKNVLHENAEQERELDQKYPWFELLHKYITVLCAIILSIALIFWGIQSYADHVADNRVTEVTEQKDKEHQDYIDQQEADRKAAEQALEKQMIANAKVKAKLGYGSRNFIEKYNYSDADFMTLYQCVDNRLKNSMYVDKTIEDIVFQEGQFIAAYDTNPSDNAYYYNLAMKSERLKHEREVNDLPEPVGSDYIYTIYTPHGIFLANDPKAPAYTWWRYSE